jgi:hypothetical protein
MDSDGDGVGDACDNCVDTPNADQENTDGDEYGDVCDDCPNDAANKCNDCINVIDGGAIKGNQTGCGEFDPDVIMSTREPAFQQGESAEIEYLWMKSTVNVPFDPTDPNTPWEMIPGSDDASYDPGVVTETTYYQRCARGVNCDDYVGESNVVVITITDCEECDGIDNDGDGQIDEGYPDTDKDGIADCIDECDDRDDDNDGIPNCDDICLLGDDNADADNDGVPDACDTCPFESNPGAEQDADDDNDGIPNACDNCAEIGNGNQTDTDGDGIGDACDTCGEGDDSADADGDGIPDACDTEECDNVDNDGDGMVDEGFDDTDNDGIADCVDTEECDGIDNDGDGMIDEGFDDTDNDGIADCVDTEECDGIDNDGDGMVDEGFDDTDNDGIADCVDTEECDGVDNDGDGMVDEGFDDTDNDGIADCVDTEECDGVDNDGDGMIDEGFDDTDNDGIADCVDTEECDGIDNDGDGMVDEGLDCTSDCVATSTSEDCDVATITYTLSKTDQCGDPSHFVIKVPDCVSLADITVTGEAQANGVSMDNGPCDFFPGMKVVKIDIDQSQGGAPYVINVSIHGTAISANEGMIGVKGGQNCTETSGIPGFVCYDYDANDSDDDGTPDCDDTEECDGVDNDGDGMIDEGFADEDGDNIGDECDDCVNFKPGDDGGDIAEDQTICEGETPAKLTSISLPSGHGQGDIEYIWVKY